MHPVVETAAPPAATDGLLSCDRLLAFDGRAFASPVRLLVHEAPSAAAEAAWRVVFDELAAVDDALSRFRADSEVTDLCRRSRGASIPVRVSRRLRVSLVLAERARRVTGGRFDPRVLRDLERLGDTGAPIGDSPQPGDAGRPTGPLVESSRAGVTIATPMDLGGIGKGLAARWAASRALLQLNAGSGLLLDLGGDLVAAGRPVPDGWRVGIEDPFGGSDRPLVAVRVTSGAVATSSIRNRAWRTVDGRSVHHLIDPMTGEPGGAGLAAVTVAHADPAWAEIWSKALFLAGAPGIADEARSRDLAAWWIDRDGDLAMTPAARQASAWVDEARLG